MDVARVLHSPVCLALLSTIQAASAVRRSLPKENVSGHACGHAAASAIHLSSSLSLWSPSQCATVHTSVTTDYTNHKQVCRTSFYYSQHVSITSKNYLLFNFDKKHHRLTETNLFSIKFHPEARRGGLLVRTLNSVIMDPGSSNGTCFLITGPVKLFFVAVGFFFNVWI